jgi:undecaprenyl-diphosphatase
MDMLLVVKAVIIGVVEGLTEFLPISSTGHLIIAGELLDFLSREERGAFEMFIQLGAILAVCWEYRRRLIGVVVGLPGDPAAQRFAANLLIAFLPAAVIGLLLVSYIKSHLFSAVPVAMALIVGGLAILWAERREHVIRIEEVDEMTWRDALKVGFAQCFALIPGTSRSGATIVGGLLFGLSRRAATEFSFFLAIPTLVAAGLYDLYRQRDVVNDEIAGLLAIGLVAAFISAFIAVRGLLRYISRHDFTIFAWYRIAFGLVVLVTAYSGLIDWEVAA